MSYRDSPPKEKLRPPPGPWHKFIEAVLVIGAAVWLNIVSGIGIYKLLKAWAPSDDCGFFAFMASVVLGFGMVGAIFSLAERRDW